MKYTTKLLHYCKNYLFISTIFITLQAVSSYAQTSLRKQGTATQLIVNDSPFIIIGGELGNSSASTEADLKKIFPYLQRLGLNTVLVPITWEQLEPKEGTFDFTMTDKIINQARSNNLKIVLLWFGAWKNSMSCYAPEWFKRDISRFPRVHNAYGKPLEEASSLSRNVLEADKKAFCQLINHICEIDKQQQTVIMVQVENEIGMVESPRDYSDDATKLYNSNVPEQLINYIKNNKKSLHPQMLAKWENAGCKTKGTWKEIFGDDIYSEEIFQAWTFATYVQKIASAGRTIYNIPMYVNVALNSRGRKPGEYPSAGPLDHLIDVWHCGAPSIDILGLDLYDKGFKEWTEKYKRHNNPLFIPEIRLEDEDAMRALYAFGQHDAMGFCPFSIEDYPYSKSIGNSSPTPSINMDVSKDDQINAFTNHAENVSPLVSSYSLLNQLVPFITAKQGMNEMNGVLLTNDEREQIVYRDGIRMTVRHSYSLGWETEASNETWPEAGGIIIKLADEDYLIAGSGIVVTFTPDNQDVTWKKGDIRIGIASCQHVEIENGKIKVVRYLNGDQTHQGRHIRIPAGQFAIQHVRLYKYK